MENTILTFTKNDEQFIKINKFDAGWTIDEKRASNCKYLVCCHSQGAKKGAAFCVGLIDRLEPVELSEGGKQRYAIYITDYAPIDLPDIWDGGRFPVRYTNLIDLGIDLSSLQFEPLGMAKLAIIPPLSIAQAKEGLAKNYNIEPDQIEILIKG